MIVTSLAAALAFAGSRSVGTAVVAPGALEPICRFRAVLFAAQDYENNELGFPDLSTPISDIRALGRLLEDQYGFEVERHEDVTRTQIVDTLDRLLLETRPCDALIVYYAGHGVVVEQTQRGYWQPVSATTSTATWVSNDDVLSRLGGLTARHLLLVVDSCFSGTLFREVTRGDATERGVEATASPTSELARRQSRWLVTSGGTEPVVDRYRGRGMSVFAYFLLEELRHAESPEVTIDDLFPRVRANVGDNADQVPMQGPLQRVEHEGGVLVMRNRAASGTPNRPQGTRASTSEVRDEGATAATMRRTSSLGPMVDGRWVEAGAFQFGGSGDPWSRRVQVDRFWIMRSEVTRGLWAEVMGVDAPGSGSASHPAHSVSWTDAVTFANALSERHGLPAAYELRRGEMHLRSAAVGYRLPTEVEWERAARGGVAGQPFAGAANEQDLRAVAWVAGTSTHPVCSRRANALDLCDMTGNVAEWTGDLFQKGGVGRVVRGGHWHSRPLAARVFVRDYADPDERHDTLGLRLVRSGS